MYTIGCQVSGGITGTKFGTVKNEDGTVKGFDTEEEAQNEAQRLNNEMNHDRSKAGFRYWVW